MERVVFFGTGPVAAKSLELLAKSFEIEAVVTKPKPEHHRGNFPVLDVAEKLKLHVKTVTNKADLSELLREKPFTSQVGVLIDFGIIVSQDVIDYFPKGIVNSHFSLLPEWRGADPITFSILSGQKRTGVSLMILVEKMDEGPLIAGGFMDISPEDTTTSLTERLIDLSNSLLRDKLPLYLAVSWGLSQENKHTHMPGYPSDPSYSRKLTKEDGRLDWSKPADQLEREVRAFSEWPKSYTNLFDKDVIVTEAHAVASGDGKPGEVSVDNRTLSVCTSEGRFVIDNIKPAGKQEMTAESFIAGYAK